MTDAEDQIASDHSRALRGMSTSAMRLIEIVQRRQEDARRREADGQREAAQALRDRQEAQRTAARTLAAQGLDPHWREAAGDREIATAFVYAEAYAETDPLARVAHEQLSQMLAERHDDVAAFIDDNVTQQDLDRVPAPEGEPSPTQQRWMDAARAHDAAERHEQHLEQLDPNDPDTLQGTRVLDAQALKQWSDQTVAGLVGEDSHTFLINWSGQDGAAPTTTVLDPEAVQRWSDEPLAELLGKPIDQVVLVPEQVQQQRERDARLAVVGEDVANQWADLSEQFDRDRADRWLNDNLTPSEMAELNKWQLWNEAQLQIAEGASIQETMEDLADKETQLGLDLELDETAQQRQSEGPSDQAEHEGKATTALERGDMEHAGLGQFPDEKKSANDDLAQRDPQAAEVLGLTHPGRSQSAAEQVARAAKTDKTPQRKARKHGQERGPERTLNR